jgi:methylmalonyl-CoA/ethylmalonyl-CoA epimerase
MPAEPTVLGPTELDNAGAVGETIQVAIVTDDLKNALDHLTTLGIGPWMVMSLDPSNSDMKYKGEKSEISMKVAFTNHGSMMWEVIQPTGGDSIYQDFLDEGRQGFHHVGIDGGGRPYAEQEADLKSRGYEEVQGGTAFDGNVPFAYFHNGAADSPLVEIFEFPEGFEPTPEEWYPAPPPAA